MYSDYRLNQEGIYRMKRGKYYSPAEFANLFNIDRQTLIYYDNHGIFSPSLRSEKGYRYYSLDQVFRFAEILSLRNLTVPGTRLSDYNQTPSISLLHEILHDKIMEYEETLHSLTSAIRNLKLSLQSMEETGCTPLDQMMLIPRGPLYCQKSRRISYRTSHRDALLQNASLVSMYSEGVFSKHLQFSFLPSFTRLEDLAKPHDYHIVLISQNPECFSNPLILPPSLYLTVILKNRFHRNRKLYIDRLSSFMEKLQLKPGTTFFISSVKNCWTDERDNPSFYTKLELAVHY